MLLCGAEALLQLVSVDWLIIRLTVSFKSFQNHEFPLSLNPTSLQSPGAAGEPQVGPSYKASECEVLNQVCLRGQSPRLVELRCNLFVWFGSCCKHC